MLRLVRIVFALTTLLLLLAGCGGGGNPTVLPHPGVEMLVGSAANAKILRFNADTGAYLGIFAQGGDLVSPNGIAVLSDGTVAVGDFVTHKVLRYDANGNLIETLGTLTGTPYGMLATEDDGFLVSEYDSAPSGRVLRWTAAAGFQTFIEGGPLNGPDGMVIRDGVLYVSSQKTNAVLKYNANTGAFLGELTKDGKLGEGANAGPSGLTFGFENKLFIAQHDNDPAVTKGGNVLSVPVTGTTTVSTLVDSATDALSGPIGIAFVSVENRPSPLPDHLLVTSAATNEVRAYDASGRFLGALATGHDLQTPIYLALRFVPRS